MSLPRARILVPVVVLLTLAGCTSVPDGTATAPTSTTAAGTSSPTETADPVDLADEALTPENFAARLGSAAQAAGTYTQHKTTVVSSGDVGGWVTTQVRYTDDRADFTILSGIEDDVVDGEMRWIDGVLYTSAGSGSTFTQVEADDALVETMRWMDPMASLDLFDGAIVSVEKSGSAVELDGVQAQPYLVVLDTATLAASAPEAEQAHIALLPEQVEYEYWVGPDDLIRRTSADLVTQTVDALWSGWGGEVDVVAPDPDQLTTGS